MKMQVRCPRCSFSREVESENANDRCTQCGYMVTEGPVVAEQVVKIDEPRRRMASMAGGPSQLENATRDLFRLSGGQSIPVEARSPAVELKPKVAPPAFRQPEPAPASGRKAEASILFSLESLMKAASTGEKQEEDTDQPLWSMQAEAPLFGTAQDHALLTTPLEPPPGSNSMDSMTVSSRRPAGMRMWPVLLAAAGAGALLLAGAGWFVLRPPSAENAGPQALDAPQERSGVVAEEATPAAQPVLAAAAPVPEPAAAQPPVALAGAVVEPNPADGKEPRADAESKTGSTAKPAALASKVPSSAKKPLPRATKPAAAAFDVTAAKNALNGAASKAATCSGTSGKGKVQLTFAPTGKVASAEFTDGPFAGTPAGKCALRHFKAARVPAFSGTPQTVAKSFKIP